MKVENILDVILCEFDEIDSSYIQLIIYNKLTNTMDVQIRPLDLYLIYLDVPAEYFMAFSLAESKGKFYNNYIKSKFKTRKTMARYDLELLASIDLMKINKDLLLKATKVAKDGHTPVYMNIKLLYSKEPDNFGQNGFITQSVPKALKGVANTECKVLGNIKDFTDYQRADLAPVGSEEGTANDSEDSSDDLPF